MSIVTFDHLGYGFSDKPSQGYTYSLMDQADNALTLWRKLGIAKAHIVSHDMGDSVMTEILTRKMNGQLPDYFKDFFQVKMTTKKMRPNDSCLFFYFQSITFTNGGMRLRLANLRLGQRLYTLPYIKDLFHVVSSHLPPTFRDQVTVRGLESIWSPTYEDQAQKYGDIDDIITLIRLNGGSAVLFKTISYLEDRFVRIQIPDADAFFKPQKYDSVSSW